MQRTKGAAFERKIARAFRAYNGKRLLEYQQATDRATGMLGVDVLCDRFAIQCKRYQGYAPISKLAEVVVPDGNLIPLLITKADRQQAVVVIGLDDFLELLHANGDGGNGDGAARTDQTDW